MSKKNKDGVFSLLRQILAEQKKQTKILQAIESSQEQEIKVNQKRIAGLLYAPKPCHIVTEKDDGLWIDDFKVNFVVSDSVKTKKMSSGQIMIDVCFIAKSFEKITTKD